MLSSYFKNNNVNDMKYDKIQFIKKKGMYVHLTNRSICNMLRNLNIYTKQKYEKKIVDLLKYMDNAITILESMKRKKNPNHIKRAYTRSTFTEQKLKITKEKDLINLKNNYFEILKFLFEKNAENRYLIYEILYYSYKVNLKFLEYENIGNIQIINDVKKEQNILG